MALRARRISGLLVAGVGEAAGGAGSVGAATGLVAATVVGATTATSVAVGKGAVALGKTGAGATGEGVGSGEPRQADVSSNIAAARPRPIKAPNAGLGMRAISTIRTATTLSP